MLEKLMRGLRKFRAGAVGLSLAGLLSYIPLAGCDEEEHPCPESIYDSQPEPDAYTISGIAVATNGYNTDLGSIDNVVDNTEFCLDMLYNGQRLTRPVNPVYKDNPLLNFETASLVVSIVAENEDSFPCYAGKCGGEYNRFNGTVCVNEELTALPHELIHAITGVTNSGHSSFLFKKCGNK